MYLDKWPAYIQVAANAGCRRTIVNHTEGFKDYESGETTNNVEGINSVLKRDARSHYNRLPYLNKLGEVYYLDLLVWRAYVQLRDGNLFGSWVKDLWH